MEQNEILTYRAQWAEIVAEIEKTGLRFSANFQKGLCPYMQWVRISALAPEDEPGISHNGMYVIIKIMLNEQKAEIFDFGHIWLTKEDQKASYLAMCGANKAVKAVGGKWMKKQAYKNPEDLAGKISKFWAGFIECLDKATEGYPYKQMKVNIYC